MIVAQRLCKILSWTCNLGQWGKLCILSAMGLYLMSYVYCIPMIIQQSAKVESRDAVYLNQEGIMGVKDDPFDFDGVPVFTIYSPACGTRFNIQVCSRF